MTAAGVCARLWGSRGRGASRGPEPTAELARSLRGFITRGADAWRGGGGRPCLTFFSLYGCAARAVGKGTRIGALARASILPSGEVGQGLAVARAPSLVVGVPSPEAPQEIRVIGFPFSKPFEKLVPPLLPTLPIGIPRSSRRDCWLMWIFPPVLLLCLEPTLRWRSSP